jgi:ABC-type taurine transport system ATPase subunit
VSWPEAANGTAEMLLLRMREAFFDAHGDPVGPITLDVQAGEHAVRVFSSAREATVTALLAAGIVKASRGSILIEHYDPRVQSAHCKRIAAFVPHAPLPLDESDFERYITYRAALWDVDPVRAVAHAKLLLERLEGMHEAFAYAIAGALIAAPKILVLDRPQPAHAAQIVAAAGPRAVFSTHVHPRAGEAFVQAWRDEALA